MFFYIIHQFFADILPDTLQSDWIITAYILKMPQQFNGKLLLFNRFTLVMQALNKAIKCAHPYSYVIII